VYPGSIPGVASSSINRQANSIRAPHRYRCALIAVNSGTTDFERPAARAKDSTASVIAAIRWQAPAKLPISK
jgi:hypothetical protein